MTRVTGGPTLLNWRRVILRWRWRWRRPGTGSTRYSRANAVMFVCFGTALLAFKLFMYSYLSLISTLSEAHTFLITHVLLNTRETESRYFAHITILAFCTCLMYLQTFALKNGCKHVTATVFLWLHGAVVVL